MPALTAALIMAAWLGTILEGLDTGQQSLCGAPDTVRIYGTRMLGSLRIWAPAM